jgi:tripartite-type tricarboxylate transporter receptor subunit TctC
MARFGFLATVLLSILGSSAIGQPSYPNKPVRLIVPYSTGGSTDTLARVLGQKLTGIWGQQVLVENRPGASTMIGADALAKSAPDAYTLMVLSVDHVITPNLLQTPYDPIKDFAAVGGLSSGGLALVLNPSVPANSLQEFVALVRSKPGQLNYGSPGSGGIQHLAGEMLSTLAGLKMQHIPYKGGGPVVVDLVGGQLQMYFTPPVTVVSHIKAGRLKALAISGDKRVEALPQVPTFAEAGMPAFTVTTWFGMAAPAATPAALINKVSADVAQVLRGAEVKEKIASLGMDPFIATPEQFGAFMKSEMAKFSDAIKKAGIKLQQ